MKFPTGLLANLPEHHLKTVRQGLFGMIATTQALAVDSLTDWRGIVKDLNLIFGMVAGALTVFLLARRTIRHAIRDWQHSRPE